MALRPIFIPDFDLPPYVKEIPIEFEWYPGFAVSQQQKSILSLHSKAKKLNIYPILEISTKSNSLLGQSLSAFNLKLQEGESCLSVECAFQGSKIFSKGGPYQDLYSGKSIDAKRDDRLMHSGDLIGFRFFKDEFPTKPFTAFYDWLYIKALLQNKSLTGEMNTYKAFSDIAFNPQKSINCQARSAALFVALSRNPNIDMEQISERKEYFLKVISNEIKSSKNEGKTSIQMNLPL